jgi:hypothetical protein
LTPRSFFSPLRAATFLFLLSISISQILISCSSKYIAHNSQTASNENSSQADTDFDSQFNNLSVGIDSLKAKELLGNPSLKEAKDSIEIWHYNKNGGRFVQLTSGKVTSFGKSEGTFAPTSSGSPQAVQQPLAQPSELNQTPIAQASRQIGGACSKDKDCKGDNCHFKICSGRNNCQKTVGQVCATDEDCCNSRCNFGFCKTVK